MTIFSERITELMTDQGLSQKELARKVGVTESAMSYYVNGERVPRSDVLVRIANELQTSTDFLLGNTIEFSSNNNFEELQYLQRNLGKLNAQQIKKAENILKAVFDDIFNDDEDEED